MAFGKGKAPPFGKKMAPGMAGRGRAGGRMPSGIGAMPGMGMRKGGAIMDAEDRAEAKAGKKPSRAEEKREGYAKGGRVCKPA